jgi:hypothetical protein
LVAPGPKLIPVSLFRGLGRGDNTPLGVRGAAGHEEKRPAVRSTLARAGTLACAGCDAPIAIGAEPLRLTDRLTCPFCLREGPVRDFLSLAAPTRPARVVVRLLIQ